MDVSKKVTDNLDSTSINTALSMLTYFSPIYAQPTTTNTGLAVGAGGGNSTSPLL
jgi:predicted NodU family carbamoyl transferase